MEAVELGGGRAATDRPFWCFAPHGNSLALLPGRCSCSGNGFGVRGGRRGRLCVLLANALRWEGGAAAGQDPLGGERCKRVARPALLLVAGLGAVEVPVPAVRRLLLRALGGVLHGTPAPSGAAWGGKGAGLVPAPADKTEGEEVEAALWGGGRDCRGEEEQS